MKRKILTISYRKKGEKDDNRDPGDKNSATRPLVSPKKYEVKETGDGRKRKRENLAVSDNKVNEQNFEGK